ncbi:MAG: DUF1015 domain-containing protein [Chloroherpetonaceae bacterium]|nr:DUF1015 domain-containing protein [Chloroherpetonaceae bacterium]
MAEIAAFRGITYNPERIASFEDVLCPPYDVISEEMQAALYAKSEYNAVRLELPKEENKYEAAAERLSQWLASGVLRQDEKPAIYPYHQTFTTKEGKVYTRKGFIACCKLYEFSEGIVLPHEKTLSGPKKDRLQLFVKTQANISPIFGLYSDAKKEVEAALASITDSQAPFIDAINYQQTRNRVWRCTHTGIIEQVVATLREKQIFIADGHHRYETALNYRNLRRAENPHHQGSEAYNFIMIFLTNMFDEGLVVFPTHRLVHSLPQFELSDLLHRLQTYFRIEPLPDKLSLKAFLARHLHHAFGVVAKGQIWGLHLTCDLETAIPDAMPAALKTLDVTLLHHLIIGKFLGLSPEAQALQTNLNYSKDMDEVFEQVEQGKAQLGFIMNPTSVAEVEAVSKIGEVMPQKSTFFYPKVLTGTVMYRLV